MRTKLQLALAVPTKNYVELEVPHHLYCAATGAAPVMLGLAAEEDLQPEFVTIGKGPNIYLGLCACLGSPDSEFPDTIRYPRRPISWRGTSHRTSSPLRHCEKRDMHPAVSTFGPHRAAVDTYYARCPLCSTFFVVDPEVVPHELQVASLLWTPPALVPNTRVAHAESPAQHRVAPKAEGVLRWVG